MLSNRRRRARLEKLERRDLLTIVAPDLLYAPVGEQFTVRRDEPAPVELHLYFGLRDWQPGDVLAAETTGVDRVDAENGSAQIARDGRSILYQPEPGFVGIDIVTVSFPVIAADGSQPDQRQIAVNVIEPLLAVDDWFQVDVDAESSSLAVLDNDIRNGRYVGKEPELTLTGLRADSGGVLSISDDETSVNYQPAAGFTGVETITYTAIDQDGYSSEGIARVRVDDLQSDVLWPEQLQTLLVQTAAEINQYSFGNAFYQGARGLYFFGLEGDVILASAVPEATGADFSGTNNQIAEVDESDRVKTDGEYLYVLSSPDQNGWPGWDIFPRIGLPEFLPPIPEPTGENLLTIVDVRQPDAPAIVSRQLFDDRVLSLDLSGDRLTVLAQRSQQTVVTTLDVSDPQVINTVSTTVVDGQFKQARRVADSLYVFTNEYGLNLPPLEMVCSEDENFCFQETGQQYLDRVADTLVEAVFPSQQVFDGDGQLVTSAPTMLVDPLSIGVPGYRGRLNIITFDTAASTGGALDWDLNDAGEHVLVTPDSIYVTKTDYQSSIQFIDVLPVFNDIPEQPAITTAIDRFELQADGSVQPSASAVVPGVLNNSFSIDEYDGLLRIATENSWWSVSPEDDGTNIYVLQQTGDSFDVIGGVTGLAPGEQIYAVRFAGQRGYVVTFRRVDPLFVVDLSDPTSPQVLGELKTPGYSQYLHIVDENHLIGVGRDADEETGLYKGLVISLFNVSDPTNPMVQDRFEFDGGRTTFSPFAEDDPWDLRDHHAISYFRESGILALPIYSKQNRWIEEDQPIFASPEQSEVRTFRIDTADGIESLDTIRFDSRADRTVRIGGYLYSLSNSELKVTDLDNPDGIVAELPFERNGEDDFVDVEVGDSVMINVIANDGSDQGIQILDADLLEGEGEVAIEENQIRFTPLSRSLAQQRIRYLARDTAGTLIDAVATVDPDIQWQNQQESLDVNNDGKRSARDALNVINWVTRYGAVDSEEVERQIGDADSIELFYFDTTGDGQLSSLDALLVINELIAERAVSSVFSAEGESISSSETSAPNDVDLIDIFWAQQAGRESQADDVDPVSLLF